MDHKYFKTNLGFVSLLSLFLIPHNKDVVAIAGVMSSLGEGYKQGH